VRGPTNLAVTEIEEGFERVVGKASFREVQQALAREARDGTLIRVGERYTTLEALRVEHQIIEKMKEGQNSLSPLMNREEADQTLSGHGLTAGQERTASHILTSADRFIGVEGWAGTGKTTMLERVQEATGHSRVELRGLAVSASAARSLETESGIPSETVAQFLNRVPSSAPDGVQRAYVIDEASLLGARTAHAVMARVEHENARAIFLGDRNQLAAIEAGKPFAVLVNHGMHTERMDEILRQRDPALKSLVEQAAQGRTVETVGQLQASGRLIAISDRTERLTTVAQEYLRQTLSEQEHTLVLSGSRADRSTLNKLIRAGLQQQGALSGPERHADVLVQRDLTKAQLREAASLNIGDVVRFGKDYRGVGLMKGEYGVVEGTNPDQGTVSLRMEANGRAMDWQPDRHVVVEVFQKEQRDLQDGDLIRWTRNDYSQHRRNGDLGRVSIDSASGSMFVRDRNGKETVFNPEADRHWDHGYASTVHASQGRTADRTIYHADSQQLATNKEGWYVAVSRARDDLRVVTDDVAALKEAVAESRTQASALEAVARHRSQDSHAVNPELRESVSERTGPSRQMEIER
jgi:ATP-dependent exoDNAse (exonuclease V) alpha subunit